MPLKHAAMTATGSSEMSRGLLLPAVFLVVQALGDRPDFRFVFKKLEIKGGKLMQRLSYLSEQ